MANIDLEKLNEVINRGGVECLEQRSISLLPINEIYNIKKLIVLNTRFGKAIMAVLQDTKTNSCFKTFLPKRVNTVLTDDIVNEINLSEDRYTLSSSGQSTVNITGAKPRCLIKFGYTE